MEDLEVLHLVENLNDDMYVNGGVEDYKPFIFVSNGDEHVIEFMGVPLWDSDNNPIGYREDGEEETLREFLIRESKRIVIDLNSKMLQL